MSAYYSDDTLTLHVGEALDVLATLPDGSADCIVTSPPYYGLRDYGHGDQLGLEPSPAEYVARLVGILREARRVLAKDGTLWLNLGDTYATGSKSRGGPPSSSSTLLGNGHIGGGPKLSALSATPVTNDSGLAAKNLLGIPWRVAFALQADGWILRNAIVWDKPNAMPESVRDRLSTTYELVFLFSRSPRYFFDLDPIRERAQDRGPALTFPRPKGAGEPPAMNLDQMRSYGHPGVGSDPRGRNPGDVWSISTQPFAAAHFAVMPPALARRCILAGCRPGGTVLDPFSGSGTTGMVAQQLGRRYIGIDLNTDYHDLALKRMADAPLFMDYPELATATYSEYRLHEEHVSHVPGCGFCLLEGDPEMAS